MKGNKSLIGAPCGHKGEETEKKKKISNRGVKERLKEGRRGSTVHLGCRQLSSKRLHLKS